MIASATFRLHPIPEATATAVVSGLDPAGVVELVAKLRAAQLEPSSVVSVGGDVGVRFEGFEHGVRQQLERLGGLTLIERVDESWWRRHDAVRTARGLAQAGDAVVLSPACASYDMFQNFEHRGRVFREAVAALGQGAKAP